MNNFKLVLQLIPSYIRVINGIENINTVNTDNKSFTNRVSFFLHLDIPVIERMANGISVNRTGFANGIPVNRTGFANGIPVNRTSFANGIPEFFFL